MKSRCVLYSTSRLLNTSSYFFGKWFYVKNVSYTPPTKCHVYYDWDHKEGLGVEKTTPLKGVTELDEYKKLPEILQKKYTYNFVNNKLFLQHQIQEKLDKLGVDQISNPLAWKIINTCVRMQMLKEIIRQFRKCKTMHLGLLKLQAQKKENLLELMLVDKDLAKKICEEFEITPVYPEPRKYEPFTEKYAPVILESRSIRQRKMKIFQEEMDASKAPFLVKKEKELQQIRENLNKINLKIEDVFKDVIKERQDKLMGVIYNEKNQWFENEKVLKIQYAKEKADKIAAREKQIKR